MSETRFWAVLFPFEHPEIEIDVNVEKRFHLVVQKHFPVFGNVDERIDLGPRSRDTFQIHRLIQSSDFERVWQFDSTGTFGLASQIAWRGEEGESHWSLYDLVIDLASLFRASREFWESFGYLGGARLVVRLRIDGLTLFYDQRGFQGILYHYSAPIARYAIAISPSPVTTSPLEEELDVTFQTDVVYVVARIVNQLMRSQGHSADLPKFEQSIRAVLPPSVAP
jgi:hypothetical protein